VSAAGAWRLLHVTPHLGGGVGQALLALAEGAALLGTRAPRRTVLCLEAPQRTGAVDRLRERGVTVRVLSDTGMLGSLARAHDLVQFEVWNHPALFAAWHELHEVPLRMVFWCHVSGTSFPRLPPALWQQPFPVAMTAPCSLRAADAALRDAASRGQVQVISSAAGFERWPDVRRRAATPRRPRYGYLGSLNLAKMHPDYVDWLAAARQPGLSVEVLGEEVDPGSVQQRCLAWGQPGLLRVAGYCDDVRAALNRWDAMIYLLNPHHYGTAELALLEAMASGVAPIVCDNPCERDIVENGITGCVVRDARQLAATLGFAEDNPAALRQLGRHASQWVRERFTLRRQVRAFERLYGQALALPRQAIDWRALNGPQPWQWFLSTLPEGSNPPFVPGQRPRLPSGHARYAHLERTKGSVRHFASHFPHDPQLACWAAALEHAGVPERAAVAC